MPKMKADHHLYCLATMTCNSSWLANNLVQFSRSYLGGGQLQVPPGCLPGCLSCGLQQGFSDLEHKSASETIMAGEFHRLEFHPPYLPVSQTFPRVLSVEQE